ncbi:MAG TPA: LysR family transcriptional regulator ArgP [Jiangellaceae bacterium]|nr:LysR family transcriptional regulator ArgP [Jiangellaceae bacterium]
MTNLDHAHLAAFSAVLNEGSFEAAAKRLHVTPSAISQRIKSLESRLGQVVVRRTRPVEPTEAGRVLLRLANQTQLIEHEALAALAGGIDGAPEPLRVPLAVNADSLSTWFLAALAGVPGSLAATFDIRAEDQDHSAALLREGTVMAAVTAEPRVVQGCRAEPLGAMRYFAVASPEFRERFLPDGPTRAALAGAPMLKFNRKDALQDRFLHKLTGERLSPPVTYLPSSQGFLDAARLGLGWGMVPEQLLGAALKRGQVAELAPDRYLDVPLYWQRWRLDSPALDAVTSAVHQAAKASLRIP